VGEACPACSSGAFWAGPFPAAMTGSTGMTTLYIMVYSDSQKFGTFVIKSISIWSILKI